jgi:hypothetical protein
MLLERASGESLLGATGNDTAESSIHSVRDELKTSLSGSFKRSGIIELNRLFGKKNQTTSGGAPANPHDILIRDAISNSGSVQEFIKYLSKALDFKDLFETLNSAMRSLETLHPTMQYVQNSLKELIEHQIDSKKKPQLQAEFLEALTSSPMELLQVSFHLSFLRS